MALPEATPSTTFVGNASTATHYAIPWRFDDSAWLRVELTDADGGITTLALGVGFLVGGDGAATTGWITTTVAYSSDFSIRVYRSTTLDQEKNLTYNGSFSSSEITAALDKLTMQGQDLRQTAIFNEGLSQDISDAVAAAETATEASEVAVAAAIEVEAAARFTVTRDGAVAARTNSAFARVVFVCDDGAITDYTFLRPVFANDAAAITALGLTPGTYNPCVGTIGLVSDHVGNGGQMSAAQAIQMVSEGWEMASHSKSHIHITGSPTATMEEEILGSKEALAALGIPVLNYVWPFGENNNEMRGIAARGYRSAVAVVTSAAFRNVGPVAQFALNRYGMEGDTAWTFGDINTVAGTIGTFFSTLQDRKNLVDAAISEGGLLIFMVHSGPLLGDPAKAQMLIDLLEYIQGLPEYGDTLEITTLDEALDTHGNKYTSGDYMPEPIAGTPPPESRPSYSVTGANGVDKSYTGQDLWLYEDVNGRSNASLITDFALGHITVCVMLPGNLTGLPYGTIQGILTTYRLHAGGYDDRQQFQPYQTKDLWQRTPTSPSDPTWTAWALVRSDTQFPSASMTLASGVGITALLNLTQGGTLRGRIESGFSSATNTIFWSGTSFDRAVIIGAGGRHNLQVGWSSIGTSAPEEGFLSHSDNVVNTVGKGHVVRSPDGNYWRLTVSNAGVVGATSLGASAPS